MIRSLADRFAAAAAVSDPSLMLRLRLTETPREPPARPRRDRDLGAPLIALAVVVALVWANLPLGYAAFWDTHVGAGLIAADLRTWVNEGLMTLFFLVVGLEAKREFDIGALRERRRLAVPVLAALGGIVASAAVYVAVTGGGPGWGVAISTDTALALGALTLVHGDRVFLLTLLVVDDVVALLVISFVYSEHVDLLALAVAAGLLGLLLTLRTIAARQFRARGTSSMTLYVLTIAGAAGLWLALFASGIDPVVSGLLIGLLTNAYEPKGRPPSPNERIQHRVHPLTSLAIVPVFALANAGVALDGELLTAAATSAITWGIVLAYAVGKPLGIAAAVWASRRAHSCLRATAFSAGVGFTVSLLIASRVFDGAELDQARLGILATALLAPLLALASTVRVPRLEPCAAR
jgi:Na+/H+ antiporter NhaA